MDVIFYGLSHEPYFGLLSIITDLSKMLDGVSFLPHVTFGTSESPEIFDIEHSPIEVQFQKLHILNPFSSRFTSELNSKHLQYYRSRYTDVYKIPPHPHLSYFMGE